MADGRMDVSVELFGCIFVYLLENEILNVFALIQMAIQLVTCANFGVQTSSWNFHIEPEQF